VEVKRAAGTTASSEVVDLRRAKRVGRALEDTRWL
jgi:hypothetical protein